MRDSERDWEDEFKGRDHSEYMGRWGKRRDTISRRKRDPLIRGAIVRNEREGGGRLGGWYPRRRLASAESDSEGRLVHALVLLEHLQSFWDDFVGFRR